MATWMHRKLTIVVSMLFLLSLVASPTIAQDGGIETGTPASVEAPARATEATEPVPAPTEPVETPVTELEQTEPIPAVTEPQSDTAPISDAAPSAEQPSVAPVEEAPTEPVENPTAELAQPSEPTIADTGGDAVSAPPETITAASTQAEVLPAETSLTVTVRATDTSAAIAGATVTVYDITWVPVSSGTTDDSGVFAAGTLAEGEYIVQASADGYLTSTLYPWVGGDTHIEIWLQPAPQGGSLSLLVTDQSTSPIEGASVNVYDASWNQVASGSTAPGGLFSTPELAGGQYWVEVAHPAYYGWSGYLEVNGSVEYPITLQSLPDAGVLTIRVIEQGTELPIAGAAVTVWADDGITGATDETGTFVAGELPGGEYYTEVSAAGYYGWWGFIATNGTTEWTVTLERTPDPGTLTIHVVDSTTNAPIAGASVQVWANDYSTGTTDELGTFATSELPGGTYYYAEASAGGHLAGYASGMVAGATEVTITLDPILSGILTVRAVNQENGEPIEGANVIVRSYWTSEEVASGPTNADGTFATGELPGDDYAVEVSAENYVSAYWQVFINGATEITVSLQPRFTGVVTVTVVELYNLSPIAGATVIATDEASNEVASGVTDASGVFVTPDLPGGHTWFQVTAQGYQDGYAYLWVNGRGEVYLELSPLAAGDLTVTVTELWSWTPVSGATVVVRDAFSNAEVASGSTDVSGVYVATGLPGGSYTVEVTADGYFPASGTATVNGGGWVTLEMRPQVDGELVVSVWSSGYPVAEASVTVTDPDGNVEATGATGEDGTFITGTLDGGYYDVAVTATGYVPGQTQAFVSGPSSASIWLEPMAGTLTLVIVDAVSGAPIEGASVTVHGSWSVVATGTTDGNGEFTTGVLEPVEYYVEASADGYFWTSDRPSVRGDTVFTLALEPRVPGALTVLVTDVDTGEPIHKASVVVSGETLGETATGTTDNKGIFVTGTLPGDWYRVEVSAEGYSDGSRYPLISGPTEVTFALEPRASGRLTVTVVDQVTGEAVANAAIEVRDYETWKVVESGATKNSGVFTSKELPGGHYSIEVTAEGYFIRWNYTLLSGDTEVEIWVYPTLPGTLTVTVLEQGTDAPIAGAEVVVRMSDSTEIAIGTTNDSGVFVTGTLETGGYAVDVTAEGYLPNRDLYAFVNGDSGVTAWLAPSVAGGLTVTVFDQSIWEPMPGATVTVRDDWTGAVVATGVTDANGTLVISDLPGGDYIVGAAAEGYVPSGFAFVRISGPASVELWMEPGEPGTLTLTVFDDDSGSRIAGAAVVVRDASGTDVATGTTDSDGTFTTGELPTGGYRIDVTASGYQPVSDAYAVVNGLSSDPIAMMLHADATLSLPDDAWTPGMKVKIDGSGYEPGETVTIAWHDPGGTVLATTKAKRDGTIATTFTIPDTYTSWWHRVVAVGNDSGIVGVTHIAVILPGE